MNDVVPFSPLHFQSRVRPTHRDQLFLGGVVDTIGSAAQDAWGGIQEAGNFVAENPRLVGTVAGAAAAPFTGGLSLQAGMSLGSSVGGVASQLSDSVGPSRGADDRRQRARRVLARRRRSATPSYGGSSGSYTRARGGAMKVSGRSHEQGGIRLPGNVEIEGGETIGRVGGGPHAFSKRLKVPGTDMTFADVHQQLVNRGAGRDRIKQLANLQAQVAGRGDSAGERQGGGSITDSTRFDQKYPEEARGRGIPSNPLGSDRVGMTGLKRIPGGTILSDFANEVSEEVSDIPEDISRGVRAIRKFFQDEKAKGGRLDDGGGYHAIKASETSGDNPKYPINSADDVRDAWKLRSHGDYNISKEKLEQRIKRKAREYDVDLPTDGGEKQGGGPLHNLPGNRRRDLPFHNLSNESVSSSTPTNVSTSSPEGLPLMGDDFSVLPPGLRSNFPSTLEGLLHDPSQVPGIEWGMGEISVPDLVSGGGQGIAGGSNSTLSLTGSGASTPSPEGGDGGQSGIGDKIDSVLPFLPGAINAARGIFGDAEGIDIPRMSIPERGINAARNMETDLNVRPQISAANQAFRSIAADPNASQAQKQAAFSKLMQQRSQIRSQEENKETQLQNRQQRLLSQLMSRTDRAEAQANQLAATREAQSQQRAETAKQNLLGTGLTQIVRARQRQNLRQEGMNRNIMAVLASMAGAPESVRQDVLESILPLIQNDRVRSALQGSTSAN